MYVFSLDLENFDDGEELDRSDVADMENDEDESMEREEQLVAENRIRKRNNGRWYIQWV